LNFIQPLVLASIECLRRLVGPSMQLDHAGEISGFEGTVSIQLVRFFGETDVNH